MARGDFFSGSERRDDRIAGGFKGYSIEDKKNVINYQKKKAADPTYKPKSYELESLKRQTMPGGGLAFSPMSKEVGQIASATSDLGGLVAASDFDKAGYDKFLQKDFGVDSDSSIYKSFPTRIKFDLRQEFKEKQRDLKYQDSSFAPVESPKENTLQKAAGFLANVFTGTQPVAAGTLDANQQVAQVSERPKLSYVNPDAKTMSLSEIADAFKPKNLFGYKDKFGRFDDPGSPLARDRAETMQRVAQNFTSPIVGDARSIAQIRADQDARMRENARLRNESFQRGERVQQRSADVTYGTNMLSNPAFGFRGRMTDDAKAQYDQSAKDATEMARTDPSLGNVIKQTINRVTGLVGGPQMSLEKIGERQLRLANKEINRPTYQKEAYARKMLGITNDQLKARNLQQIRANAEARTRAFNLQKAIKASERSARRLGGNIGTGRDGGFGTGTEGKGLPSNPKGFSGYSRKSSPGTGTGTGTAPSRSRGGISKSTSRGQGGGPSSKSKGGVSRGGTKSNTGSKKASRGTAGSSSKGGSFGGGRKSNTGSKKASRCDIRTKIDITSLTDQNLMKDDLATVAYFVQQLREK